MLRNLIPADAYMIRLITGQTVYGRKPAKRHIGICGAPDFCIEIVSDSSRKRDYGIKVQKYMNAGVREYWIVDRKREKIVCYWFEGEDAPEISMYTFRDKVPVRIYDGQLEIDFPGIVQRLWKEE